MAKTGFDLYNANAKNNTRIPVSGNPTKASIWDTAPALEQATRQPDLMDEVHSKLEDPNFKLPKNYISQSEFESARARGVQPQTSVENDPWKYGLSSALYVGAKGVGKMNRALTESLIQGFNQAFTSMFNVAPDESAWRQDQKTKLAAEKKAKYDTMTPDQQKQARKQEALEKLGQGPMDPFDAEMAKRGMRFDPNTSAGYQRMVRQVAEAQKRANIDPSKTFTWENVGWMLGQSIPQMALSAITKGSSSAIAATTVYNYNQNRMTYAMNGYDITDRKVKDLILAESAIDAYVEAYSSSLASMKWASGAAQKIPVLKRFANWMNAESASNLAKVSMQGARRLTMGELARNAASNMLRGTIKVAAGAVGEGMEEVYGDVGKMIATKLIMNPDSPMFTLTESGGGIMSGEAMMLDFAMGFIAGGIFEGSSRSVAGAWKETKAFYKNFGLKTPEQVTPQDIQAGIAALQKDAQSEATQKDVLKTWERVAPVVTEKEVSAEMPVFRKFEIDNAHETIKRRMAEENVAQTMPRIPRDVATRMQQVRPQAALQTEVAPEATAAPEIPVAESVSETTPPAQEAIPEPVQAVEPEPVATAKPEPVAEPEPSAPEAMAETAAAPAEVVAKPAKGKTVRKPKAQAEPKAEAEPKEKTEPKTKGKRVTKPKPVAEKPAAEAVPDKPKQLTEANKKQYVKALKDYQRANKPKKPVEVSEKSRGGFEKIFAASTALSEKLIKSGKGKGVSLSKPLPIRSLDDFKKMAQLLSEKQDEIDAKISTGELSVADAKVAQYAMDILLRELQSDRYLMLERAIIEEDYDGPEPDDEPDFDEDEDEDFLDPVESKAKTIDWKQFRTPPADMNAMVIPSWSQGGITPPVSKALLNADVSLGARRLGASFSKDPVYTSKVKLAKGIISGARDVFFDASMKTSSMSDVTTELGKYLRSKVKSKDLSFLKLYVNELGFSMFKEFQSTPLTSTKAALNIELAWLKEMAGILDSMEFSIASARRSIDPRIAHLVDAYHAFHMTDENVLHGMAYYQNGSTNIGAENFITYVFPTEFTEKEVELVQFADSLGFRVVFYDSNGNVANLGLQSMQAPDAIYLLRPQSIELYNEEAMLVAAHEIGHGIEKLGYGTRLNRAIKKTFNIHSFADLEKTFLDLWMETSSDHTAAGAKAAFQSYTTSMKTKKLKPRRNQVNTLMREIFAMRFAEIASNKEMLDTFMSAFTEPQKESVLHRMLNGLTKLAQFIHTKEVEMAKRGVEFAIKATQRMRQIAIQNQAKYGSSWHANRNAELILPKKIRKDIGFQMYMRTIPEESRQSIKEGRNIEEKLSEPFWKQLRVFAQKNLVRGAVNAPNFVTGPDGVKQSTANLRSSLMAVITAGARSSKESANLVEDLYRPLSKGPRGKEKLEMLYSAILYGDAMEDIRKGTLNPKKMPIKGWTLENIELTWNALQADMNKPENADVKEAFEKRQRTYKGYQDRIISLGRQLGVDVSYLSSREYYMQHVVLEYYNKDSKTVGKDLPPAFTQAFRRREGQSGKSYLTDTALVDFISLSTLAKTELKLRAFAELRKFDLTAQRGFAKRYGIRRSEDGRFDPDSLPEGMVQVARSTFGEGLASNQQAISKALNQLTELGKIIESKKKVNQDLLAKTIARVSNSLLAAHRREMMIIPREIWEAVEPILNKPKQSDLRKAVVSANGLFKSMRLTGIKNVAEYTMRNTFNDASAVITFLPGVVKPYRKTVADKNTGATKEVWTAPILESTAQLFKMFFGDGSMTPLLAEYSKMGGFGSSVFEAEIQNIQKDPKFTQLRDALGKKDWDALTGLEKAMEAGGASLKVAKKVVTGVMSLVIGRNAKVHAFVEFREQILRYAAFMELTKKIDEDLAAGGKGFAPSFYASNPKLIRGLSKPHARAFQMSQDLAGNYADVSPFTQAMSNYGVFPFARWIEVDFKRSMRMVTNAFRSVPESTLVLGHEIAASVGEKAKVTALQAIRVGQIAIFAMAFNVALDAWNAMMPDDDDLPEAIRSEPHLTLPRWMFPDDRIHYVQNLTIISDILGLFDHTSFTNGWNDIQFALRSGMDWGEIVRYVAGEAGNGLVNKVVSGITPYITTGIQLVQGKSWYPNVTDPYDVRDRWTILFKFFNLENEYNWIARRPQPEGSYLVKWTDSLANSTTKGDAALWTIRDLRSQYEDMHQTGGDGGSTDKDRAKRDAAYYYKLALRLGDDKAAEYWLKRFALEGGTGKYLNKSIGAMDPLYMMDKNDKRKFLESLTDEQYATYETAMDFLKQLQKESDAMERQVRNDASTQ